MSTKIVCFDSVDGAFWGDNPDLVVDPRAVKIEVPADVAYWRFTFDVLTQQVGVKYPGKSDEEAIQLEQEANLLQAQAEAEAEQLAALSAPTE